MSLRAAVVVGLALFSGCAGDADPTIDGTWVEAGEAVSFTAQQNADGASFVGAGTILYTDGEFEIQVIGVVAYPEVTFSVYDSRGSILDFEGGFVTPDQIDGEMAGYSNGAVAMSLVRR